MEIVKKPSKPSGWVAVGDSVDGIKQLRPDVLKQRAEKIKAIEAQLQKQGVPKVAVKSAGASARKTSTKGE